MPENEFEKKVSSEMQDLRVKPSEKVWLHVEERIRKKKKRRVFVIIFFLAGLALLGYWQRHNLFSGNETPVAKIDGNPKPDDINATEQNKATENKQETGPSTQSTAKPTENKNAPPVKKGPGRNKDEVKITVKSTRTSEPNTNQDNVKKSIPANENEKNKPVQEKKQIEEPASLIIAKTDPVKTNEKEDSIDIKAEEPGIKKELTKVPETVAPGNKVDSTATKIADAKQEELTKIDTVSAKKPLTDSAAVVVQKQTPTKKWKWGIEFTPGISSLNNEFFSLNMNKSLADAYGVPQSGSGSGFPLPPSPPSESASSFAFQIGGLAKKQLTKKSSVSVGLRYGYYSDKIRVGRDSVLPAGPLSNSVNTNYFYRVSNSFQDKINSYHFIEAPINYHLRLNKNDQQPFEWSIGFSVSRLIASNALMYDTAFRGIYYKNNKLLNKTQFSLSTGLSFTLINSKNFRWSAGPVADLHLNSLYDNPFDSRKYLFFIGLRSAVLFNQKK